MLDTDMPDVEVTEEDFAPLAELESKTADKDEWDEIFDDEAAPETQEEKPDEGTEEEGPEAEEEPEPEEPEEEPEEEEDVEPVDEAELTDAQVEAFLKMKGWKVDKGEPQYSLSPQALELQKYEQERTQWAEQAAQGRYQQLWEQRTRHIDWERYDDDEVEDLKSAIANDCAKVARQEAAEQSNNYIAAKFQADMDKRMDSHPHRDTIRGLQELVKQRGGGHLSPHIAEILAFEMAAGSARGDLAKAKGRERAAKKAAQIPGSGKRTRASGKIGSVHRKVANIFKGMISPEDLL